MKLSKANKVLAILFAITIVFLAIVFTIILSDKEYMKKLEEKSVAISNEQKTADAREALVNQLNNEYDIPSQGLCLFTFHTSGQQGKTLRATACRMMGNRKAVAKDILTNENLPRLKNVGFEQLQISQRDGSSEIIPIQ